MYSSNRYREANGGRIHIVLLLLNFFYFGVLVPYAKTVSFFTTAKWRACVAFVQGSCQLEIARACDHPSVCCIVYNISI